MTAPVSCHTNERRRIVITGGPGAGKTAVLELIRQSLCEGVVIVPEAAGIIFGGGFPRRADFAARRAAQRAIYFVQRELEAVADTGESRVALCDRGVVDSAAYWPGPGTLWESVGISRETAFARYDAVIHLRVPDEAHGYTRQNPLRTESATEAMAIDQRILDAWDGHPRRHVIGANSDFLVKATRALELLRLELPECCRGHVDAADSRVSAGIEHAETAV
jgi:predicted ATPase